MRRLLARLAILVRLLEGRLLLLLVMMAVMQRLRLLGSRHGAGWGDRAVLTKLVYEQGALGRWEPG
jgi:hypothetical protein